MRVHALFALLALGFTNGCGARSDLSLDSDAAVEPSGACIGGQAFRPTGSMTQPRAGAKVAPLRDGGALVVGGFGLGGKVLMSTERYDAESERFLPAPMLSEPRALHVATTLADGRILITGGYTGASDGSGAGVSGADIYDPESNTLRATAPMPEGRYLHSAVLLADGRVLVVGGFALDVAIAEKAALFDPGSESWTSVQAPAEFAGGYVAAGAVPTGAWLASAQSISFFEAGPDVFVYVHQVPPGYLNVMRMAIDAGRYVIASDAGWLGVGDGREALWSRFREASDNSAISDIVSCGQVAVASSPALLVTLDGGLGTPIAELPDSSSLVWLADGSLLSVGGTIASDATVLALRSP